MYVIYCTGKTQKYNLHYIIDWMGLKCVKMSSKSEMGLGNILKWWVGLIKEASSNYGCGLFVETIVKVLFKVSEMGLGSILSGRWLLS